MTRMALGVSFEQRCKAALLKEGFAVEPFGQALISEAARSWLAGTKSMLRWLPDFAVYIPGNRQFWTVDAKTKTRHDTGNCAIEMRSLYAAALIGVPVLYMSERVGHSLLTISAASVIAGAIDGKCCASCWATLVDGIKKPALIERLPVYCDAHKSKGGGGSGTPYVLVAQRRMDSFPRLRRADAP
jgi:hypothetical protein